MADARLIVFTRYPEPGTVKTRLIPCLGAQGAARLQREMTRRILGAAASLKAGCDLEVRYDGGDEAAMRRLYGQDLMFTRQTGRDLGARMQGAIRAALAEGAKRVVLIGSDCPMMTPAILREAFDKLATQPCVLGPATDGGYYLIGLCREEEGLFRAIAWGGADVLEQTLDRARAAGLDPALLPALPDIDRPSDLAFWRTALADQPARMAVVIPALNEAQNIAETLDTLKSGRDVDVIVADGGSTDATPELAAAHGARVLPAARGRARQCNAGAAAADADILLFLHADTRVAVGYDRAIRETLADPRTAAGAFRLSFDRPGAGLRLMALGANLRSRFWHLPYGDQGIFLWAADFTAAGGFPELPLMDDACFIRTLRQYGRIATIAPLVLTSARRYDRLGLWSTWIANQCALAGYGLGVQTDELARLYRAHAGPRAWSALLARAAAERLLRKKP